MRRLFAVRTGLEPATPCVTGRYSNQLNYRTVVFPFISKGVQRYNKLFFHANKKFKFISELYLMIKCPFSTAFSNTNCNYKLVQNNL